MKQQIKSTFIYLPKIIILGLTVFNFLYIQAHLQIQAGTKMGAAISFVEFTPWYEKSMIDVLILFAAAIFLLMRKPICQLIAAGLSGYIVAVGIFTLAFRKMTLLEQWKYIQEDELNIFLQWEIQFILALVILGFTIFYLWRGYIAQAAFCN